MGIIIVLYVVFSIAICALINSMLDSNRISELEDKLENKLEDKLEGYISRCEDFTLDKEEDEMIKYPIWVCRACGNDFQKDKTKLDRISTWHFGTCDICKEVCAVTQAKDFGYLEILYEED